MKTTIRIEGQPNGNRTLLNAIQTYDCEVEKWFSDFVITFQTKKEAVKALSNAFQELKSDKEDWDASCASYTSGYSINYDASRAYLE